MRRAIANALATAVTLALAASCASPTGPASPPRVEVPAPPSSPPVTTPPAPEPRMSVADAASRGHALATLWSNRPDTYEPGSAAAFFQANDLDENEVRALLEAVTRACLEQKKGDAEPEADACKRFGVTSGEDDQVVETLLEMAGEIAETSTGASATLRLLIQLEARGAWRAGVATERVLERRMVQSAKACAPPSDPELEAARADIGDLRIRLPGGTWRPPTTAELDDLAYFRASMRFTGIEVGTTPEDQSAPPLPKGSSEIARRETLRAAMTAALVDGDVARHAEAAEAYLTTLGWPGPIRVAEDGDARWGGAGFSYVLREWARSAEILGRFELAGALRRRAAPGGGMCGTSTASVLADQIEGVIRAAELRDGCRTVVAERLYAAGYDLHHSYGPEGLTRSGFDVTRLYRAALLDLGGEIDWAARVRAIPGYAELAGREAVPRLVELAEHGPTPRRVEAVETLGRVLTSYGIDPCRRSRFGYSRHSGVSAREVRTIMTDCKTKLDDKALKTTVTRIAALAGDAEPSIREAVAHALGNMASPYGRPALEKLSRDRVEAGGRICTSTGGGPQICEPNLPVRRAAKEGLAALVEAEGRRRRQAREPQKSP